MLQLALVFFAGSVMAFLPIGLYFWVATRFLMDFVPLLMLSAVLASWEAVRRTADSPASRGLLVTAMPLLIVLGAVLSFLLAVTGSGTRMDDLNPELWERLVRLFAR